MLLAEYVAANKLFFDAWDLGDFKRRNRIQTRLIAVINAINARGQRAAFLSLLDHEDPGVRVGAAEKLVKLFPGRALAVLRDVDKNGRGPASLFAMNVLWRYRTGGFDPPFVTE